MLSYTQLQKRKESLERDRNYLMEGEGSQYRDFLFESAAMTNLMQEIELVADTDASVLITGETGTGKDHIARYIHHLSRRKNHLFVMVNFAALPEHLIESELFGHAKGAFTGAAAHRVGRFEMADGGTIFLDEIGELPLNTQAKLLQVLQEQRFEPVGQSRPVSVDFRLISASNQPLKQKALASQFRSDLYYRLNAFQVEIPPLRERPADIPILVEHFSERFANRMRKKRIRFTNEALETLAMYSWPGNVRELLNVIERLTLLRSNQVIEENQLRELLDLSQSQASDGFLTRREEEKRHIERALLKCGGVVAGPQGAAKLLGLARTTLQYRMKILGIEADALKRGWRLP